MEAMNGPQLAEAIRRKAGEFRRLCDGIDEGTASRAPSGRWSPKEIVSHLCGPEVGGLMTSVKAFVEQDTPEVELHPGETGLTEARAGMSFARLLDEFDKRSGALADFVSGLSPEQLARKARIRALKESPMGEYPSLAVFLQGIVENHIAFHTDHMREIVEALRKGA